MKEPKEDTTYKVSRAQVRDWIGEANIIYGGLGGLGIVITQPFMYQGEFTGLAAKICVISFAISTPIFASLLVLNHEEEFKSRMSKSTVVMLCKGLAQIAAITGFVAAFWHISPLAGKVAAASCLLALIAHAAGYATLYSAKSKMPKPSSYQMMNDSCVLNF